MINVDCFLRLGSVLKFVHDCKMPIKQIKVKLGRCSCNCAGCFGVHGEAGATKCGDCKTSHKTARKVTVDCLGDPSASLMFVAMMM